MTREMQIGKCYLITIAGMVVGAIGAGSLGGWAAVAMFCGACVVYIAGASLAVQE